jgi:hypothetical protein
MYAPHSNRTRDLEEYNAPGSLQKLMRLKTSRNNTLNHAKQKQMYKLYYLFNIYQMLRFLENANYHSERKEAIITISRRYNEYNNITTK